MQIVLLLSRSAVEAKVCREEGGLWGGLREWLRIFQAVIEGVDLGGVAARSRGGATVVLQDEGKDGPASLLESKKTGRTGASTDIDWTPRHTAAVSRRTHLAAARPRPQSCLGTCRRKAEQLAANAAGRRQAPTAMHLETIKAAGDRADATAKLHDDSLSAGLVLAIALAGRRALAVAALAVDSRPSQSSSATRPRRSSQMTSRPTSAWCSTSARGLAHRAGHERRRGAKILEDRQAGSISSALGARRSR